MHGRIGKDAELRYTPSGQAVVDFSLAVTTREKDAPNGKGTRWWKVAVWGTRGEKLQQYLVKGTQVLVTGELAQVRTYEGKNGTTVDLQLTANTIEFIGSKSDSNGGGGSDSAPAAPVADEDIPF
jgi:single-strand DNA-binding protein